MLFPKYHPEFATKTCLNWHPVLRDDTNKDILIDSFRVLVNEQRVVIFGFVLMSNHIHLIWQMLGDHEPEAVRRDFLKYTSQQLLRKLLREDSSFLPQLRVMARDREYQIWERNSLCISLWSDWVFNQKLNCIHQNPVRAGLSRHPEEYKYSSASFYYLNKKAWEFLTHADG